MPIWCLLAAGVFLGSIVGGPQRGDLRFDQAHHAYVGVAACAAGEVLHSKALRTVGVILTTDDAVQHLFQRINYPRMGDAALQIRGPVWYGYQAVAKVVVPLGTLSNWLDHLLR